MKEGGNQMNDHDLAKSLASEAGRMLLGVRQELAGAGAQALAVEGDRRSHAWLAAALLDARPGDAVLSEEGQDDPARLTSERVWIIDPVDGTREFAEIGRDDWAVHTALWQSGELVAGAVALPAQGLTLSTADVIPARPRPAGPLRLVVSRTRPPPIIEPLLASLGGKAVPMGSAGAKAMAVVQNRADAYVHAGGQYEWDSAAPVAVARAAGLHTSRLDGSALVYNRPDPSLPDVLICRPELAGQFLDLLGALMRDSAVALPASNGRGGKR